MALVSQSRNGCLGEFGILWASLDKWSNICSPKSALDTRTLKRMLLYI